MHKSSIKRMEWFVTNFLTKDKTYKVLDVGSYDVNGSYKDLFMDPNFEYTGLDMESGPNVDIVPKKAYKWDEIESDKYDVVISGQALEHIEFFWQTMSEITRVTKKDGLICIVAPNGFDEHRYPVDCWRFFSDGMIALARYNMLKILHAHTNAAPSVDDKDWFSERDTDSMLIAQKPYQGATNIVNYETYECIPEDLTKVRGGMITYKEYQEISNIESTVEKGTKGESDEKKHLAYDIMRKVKMRTKNWFTKMKSKLRALLSKK